MQRAPGGRARALFVVICLAITAAVERESLPCREGSALGLSPLSPQADGQPIQLPGPVQSWRPSVIDGPRLRAVQLSSHHPARAARTVGRETWIATPGGVLRYGSDLWRDASRARPIGVVDVLAGLPAASVNDLSPAGRMVLVATDGGIARISAAGKIQGSILLPGRRVTALAPGVAGTWSGLLHLSSGRVVPGSDGIPVTRLLPCGRLLYVASHDRGLHALRDGTLRRVQGVPSSARVADLTGCGPDGVVWAATTAGVFAVRGLVVEEQASRRHATAVARQGSALLVGTFGEGVQRLVGGHARSLLSAAHVSLVHLQAGGSKILLGAAEGLLVLEADGRAVAVPLDGPPSGPITALAPDRGSLWVGSFDQGLARFVGGRWQRQAIFDPRVTALQLDGRGRLWVGTASGLALLQGDRLVRPSDPRGWLRRQISVLRYRGGQLFVGVHPGLVVIRTAQDPPSFRYLGAAGKEADAGIVGPTVYGLDFAASGIWIGTDDGLSQVQHERVRSLTDLGGLLPDNWINDVRAEGEALYVLTLRSGLLRLAPSGSQIWALRLMTSPGVLLPTRHAVIFGTNSRGLAVVRLDGGGRPRLIQTYGPAQGLASTMVTALAHEPGADRLWIGGAAGINRIDQVSRELALQGKERIP